MDWLSAETATWEECRDFLQACPCAILPLGATEQHGPHLPQNTDTILAAELARRVAERTRGLVLPVLPVGYCWVWRDFPGSLTLSLDTFRAVIADLARSLDRVGCRALLLLTAHGANVGPLKYAARELKDELRLRMLYLLYPRLQEILRDADSEMWLPMNFHAEEFETSLLLHLRPELVRVERAVCEYPARSPDYLHSNLEMGALSRSGVFGDPTVASAEKGERWLAACVDAIAAEWQAFLER